MTTPRGGHRSPPSPDDARRLLESRYDVGTHLTTYAAVNGLFWTAWLVVGVGTGEWFPWPLFPTAGWGVGLALQARSAYGPPGRRRHEEAGTAWAPR